MVLCFAPRSDVLRDNDSVRPARLYFSGEHILLHRQVGSSVLGTSGNRDVLLSLSNISKDEKVINKLQDAVHWPPEKLLNEGKDCWEPCGNVSGDCAWCGKGNACCRFNAEFDPEECTGITDFTVKDRHTCVTPVAYHALKHRKQECWSHCGKSGYCNWCGKGNSCCMQSGASWDSTECHGAFGFHLKNKHECVATLGECPFLEEPDGYGGCRKPAQPPALTFYMYKAAGPNWPVELNQSGSMGSLSGVMWYLHNDIVVHCPRTHGIDRIRRYMVTLKPTEALFYKTGKVFDRYVEYQNAKAKDLSTSQERWSKYGYNPGCLHVDRHKDRAAYADAIWYSMPGSCPSKDLWSSTLACMKREPGGWCKNPNGTSSCTWKAEYAGEIFLDELVGIVDYATFCSSGHYEFDLETDAGIGNDFWNQKLNVAACKLRVQRAHQLFEKKYPSMPFSMDRRPCDADEPNPLT